RDHDPLPAPELDPQDEQDHDDRGGEHVHHLRHDLDEVGVEDREAGHRDRGVRVLLLADDLLDLRPHGGQVEVLLPEAGDDERRLVVLRDEEPLHALGRVDLELQELEVLLVLGHARVHERHDLDARASEIVVFASSSWRTISWIFAHMVGRSKYSSQKPATMSVALSSSETKSPFTPSVV